MKIKRYLAPSSREALRQVKEQLGANAVILSNRQTKAGVEIMALADSEIPNLVTAPTSQHTNHESKAALLYAPATSKDPLTSEEPLLISDLTKRQETHAVNNLQNESVSLAMIQDLIGEIQTMKDTLDDQVATVAWESFTQRKPEKMKVLRSMLNAGFSPLLSRRLVDKLSTDYNFEQSLKQAMSVLAFNMRTVSGDELIENGGIYALTGPTGVGKTTTTAKLAARCVMRHGTDKVALLTTDSYRIGGHEQLRIYGQLLGIPVRTIKDTDDLQLTLSELSNKHMTLIDTVGMGQRDQMVEKQIAMLSNCGANVKRLLILSAASNGNTLDEVISAYKKNGIHGCIITKVDEAASLGVALDAVIRHKLTLYYVTNGQKVPEDIHSANPRYLLHRIFKSAPGDSPFTLQDAEFALIMASNKHSSNQSKKQVNARNKKT
ncbi:MAG: flagellar biosynthesis protein FlhF [Betaproteobacteria bacterium]|nr:flagellar biosynthesis protein FlhF [Betaproteobacteria bacterium]